MHDVFRGGVEPGGLTADFEIKMLICYLLSVLDKPIPVSILLETFVKEGIGNYFEAASAASGLVKTGHLTIEKIGGGTVLRGSRIRAEYSACLSRGFTAGGPG